MNYLRPSRSALERGQAAHWILVCALTLFGLLMVQSDLSAQASTQTPLGSNQTALSGCDDCNASVPLTSVFSNGINFGGTVYNELYISTNGYVTFGHGNSTYSPQGIAAYTQGPIIAPQYDDLDPSKGGEIWYNQNTADGHVVVTWEDVLPYSPPHFGSGTNTIQVVLRQLGGSGSQDFQIEIRYVRLDWAQAGINSSPPTGGWSAGDQSTYTEVPLSGQSNFRDLVGMSNVGVTGVFRWNVEGGQVESQPTVNLTTLVTSIGGTSAASGGNVSSDGGQPVTGRGLVWSTSSGPTLSDASVSAGSGTGSFSATMTGLSTATTYRVRTYATNSLGTGYGPERSFTTLSVVPPVVTTGSETTVTATTAEVSGEVTSDGGGSVTARGIAYGTSPAPTTAGPTVAADTGTGAFSADLEGLDPITTYHARAYAVNSAGTSYGAEISFTTEQLPQTIDFGSLGTRVYGEEPDALSATATSGFEVAFQSDDASVATVQSGTLTIHGSGTTTITATQGGSELYAPAPAVSRTLRIRARPIEGHFTIESEKVYDQLTDAVVTGMSLTGVLARDLGQVAFAAEGAHFDDAEVGTEKPVTLTGAELTGPRAQHYALGSVEATMGTIVPAPPHHVTLEGATRFAVGDRSGRLTVTVRDQYGNATPVPRITSFGLSTDAGEGAEFIRPDAQVMNVPELRISEGGSVAHFRYRHSVAGTGVHLLTAARISGASLPSASQATHELTAEVGGWVGLRIEIVGAGAFGIEQGETFRVRVLAVDEYGNRVPGARGRVQLESQGPLTIPGGLEGELEGGELEFSGVHFTDVGQFVIRASAEGIGDASLSTNTGEIEVLNPHPDVALSVEVNGSLSGPGQFVDFTVTAENRGSGPAEALRLQSPLTGVDRLEVLEATPSVGSWNATDGLWEISTLEGGASAVLTVRARVVWE